MTSSLQQTDKRHGIQKRLQTLIKSQCSIRQANQRRFAGSLCPDSKDPRLAANVLCSFVSALLGSGASPDDAVRSPSARARKQRIYLPVNIRPRPLRVTIYRYPSGRDGQPVASPRPFLGFVIESS
jgi:hypothetical protein